jgi:hypothetical protein
MSDERKVNKLEPGKVKVGDIMAFTYFVKVARVQDGGNALITENLDGSNTEIMFRGRDLIEGAASADQHSEEQKIGITKAEELLTTSYNRVMTVLFTKKDGSERKMRCRYLRPGSLAHSIVEDLEKADPKDRIRQVDHRTVRWIIVDGIKYTVGK